MRPYWNRYYSGAQGIIFVVDSTADEKSMDVAKEEFDKAINDDQLEGLPLLFLANYQDRPGAATQDQVRLKGHSENFIQEKKQYIWFGLNCTVNAVGLQYKSHKEKKSANLNSCKLMW